MPYTKVRDLISRLAEFDGELPVCIWPSSTDGGLGPIRPGVESIEMREFRHRDGELSPIVVINQNARTEDREYRPHRRSGRSRSDE